MSERLSVGLFVYFMQLCGFKKALRQRWCESGSRCRVQVKTWQMPTSQLTHGPAELGCFHYPQGEICELLTALSEKVCCFLPVCPLSPPQPHPTWPNYPPVSSTCLIVPAPFPQGFKLTSPLCQTVLSWAELSVYFLQNFSAGPLVCWWFRFRSWLLGLSGPINKCLTLDSSWRSRVGSPLCFCPNLTLTPFVRTFPITKSIKLNNCTLYFASTVR